MLAVGIGQVFLHSVDPFVEEAPCACLADAYGREIGGSVGVCKGEVSVFALEIAFFASKGDDVF